MYSKETTVDGPAEDLILKIGEDFFTRVTELACEAAIARSSNCLEIEDIKLVLERYWSITIPEYEREDATKPAKTSSARSTRRVAGRPRK